MTHDLQTVSQTLCVHTARFTVTELADYIDWLYFFHAWGFPPKCGELAHIRATTYYWPTEDAFPCCASNSPQPKDFVFA